MSDKFYVATSAFFSTRYSLAGPFKSRKDAEAGRARYLRDLGRRHGLTCSGTEVVTEEELYTKEVVSPEGKLKKIKIQR